MINAITYTDENMTKSAERFVKSAYNYGCDIATIWRPDNISDEFKMFNEEIFDGKRGARCYWLFKPYIIYKTMLEMKDGDILFYSDAGVELINNIQHITDVMNDDILLFSNGWCHAEWCKGDITYAINHLDVNVTETMNGKLYSLPDDFMNKKQVQASNIFFRISDRSKRFVKRWLMFCQMPGLINDALSIKPNISTFQDNRHDQAILSALSIKYNYPLRWFPSNTGHHIPRGNDLYPEIFRHHRMRNSDY